MAIHNSFTTLGSLYKLPNRLIRLTVIQSFLSKSSLLLLQFITLQNVLSWLLMSWLFQKENLDEMTVTKFKLLSNPTKI